MDKSATSNSLRIGDYVTFKNIKFDSFLSAEGILLEDLIVEEHVTVFDDCLFSIHLQRQYSASRELEMFLKDKEEADKRGEIQDPSLSKYLNALKRGADNENKLNDIYLKKKTGTEVCFGDIIQLFHVKSGKYLRAIPDQLAKVERENIKIILDTHGSAASYIKIQPRYKIDREGDKVLSNSEVYLYFSERTNEYVHRADCDPFPGCDREVNCSLEPTAWRMSIFQSSTDSVDSSILLASQLVIINDPEVSCNLTIAKKTPEPFEDNSTPSPVVSPTKSKVQQVDENNIIQDDDDLPEDREFAHEFGDIILEHDKDIMNSNILWFIERESLLTGGTIKLKTDKVRFKHMNSSLYLRQEYVEKPDEDYENNGLITEESVFTTTSNQDAIGTLFSLTEINSTGKFLSNGKALQIGHNNIFIERGEVQDSGDYMVKCTSDKSAALSLIITRYTGNHNSNTSSEINSSGAVVDASSTGATPEATPQSKEPLDVYVGLSARKYFKKYFEMTELPANDSVNTLWPTSNRHDFEFFKMVIKKTVFFAQGFPISSKDIQLGIDKSDALLCTQRQNLLREQGSLEIILRLISKLTPITEKMDADKNLPAKRRPQVTDARGAVNNMCQLLLQKCFHLLYYSLLNNPENQLYVADSLPVLLGHLSMQPMAGKCVTEMLSKNLALQETKVSSREIQIFIKKLRDSKMSSMYLELLQACCSCEGQGVDSNQCKVATMLFSDTTDIIIHLHSEYSRTVPNITWERDSIYAPEKPVPGSPVRGDTLIYKGLPILSLAWTTNSIDYSPLGLFGKLSVNIDELFKVQSVLDAKEKPEVVIGNKTKSKKKTADDQKASVANYFIAELFLAAEMCMDRNYIAMHKLDALFPYEVLVTILKMNVSYKLQAAAVRLLMCLHVDRDPCASSKIPRLTRTWSEVQAHSEPQLPYVDVGRRNIFGIVQQLVSEHVRGMQGTQWNDLSRHMLKMLKTLVEFNFYGDVDRMNDVITNLVAALDRTMPIGDTHTLPAGLAAAANIAGNILSGAGLSSAGGKMGNSHGDINDATMKTMKPNDNNDMSMLNGDHTLNPNNIDIENQDNDNHSEDSTGPPQSNKLMATLTNIYNVASDITTKLMNPVATLTEVAIPNASVSQKMRKYEAYKTPLRFGKAPISELETMVEAVDILAFAQRVIDDRNLSLLLRYFYAWENGDEKRSPQELFECVVEDSAALTLGVDGFDNTMIDVLMFVHQPLVQSTLEVLMAHHSKKRTLLDNARGMQLLVSHQRERQYKIVDQMLQQLEQNAETHELWGVLETDAHRAVNKQTKDILKELIDICRVRRFVLEFDEEFMADTDIQNLYRNLGCFDICMKVLGLMDTSDDDDKDGDDNDSEDGASPEVEENTHDLCVLSNSLLYWFFLGNEKNQVLGYSELDFFVDTLDKKINSHLILKAIFKMNEPLMRQVPHSLLKDLCDKIIKKGKSPHYLVLFAEISHAGERNIVENQFEIVKLLTSPGRLQKVGCFFCPVDSPEYAEKRNLMIPLLDKRDLSLDDMPDLLAYHLVFLEVLSGCTVGRDITTVEAKVQSVFSYQDQIQSILDPCTIVSTKTRLSRFFFNSVIEVDLKIPGLEQSPLIWTLLESYKAVLSTSKEEITAVERLGWEHQSVSRQKIEYIITCIQIIGSFFSRYYNNKVFVGEDGAEKPEKGSKHGHHKGIHFSLTHVDELILYFFTQIKELHDLDSKRLSVETKMDIHKALEALNKSMSGSNLIVNFIKPVNTSTVTAKNTDDSQFDTIADTEQQLTQRFDEFLSALENDEGTQKFINDEGVAFIEILEKLPFVDADVENCDVRKESLIKKLVYHIRENIKVVNNQKRLDARVTKTSTWIIRAFRTMIENKMGMSIFVRDEEGGAEQDEAAYPVVNALNSCGATALCLDLIACGIDEALQIEAIKLGVGLLFKEGGALEVQGLMNAHLRNTDSELFFKQVRLTLKKLSEWHDWQGVVEIAPDQEPNIPESVLIVRFLQLMCEGHYLPNQDLLREQPRNRVSTNLLDDFVLYLNCLSHIPCRTSTSAAIRLSATILEVIQGPCEGNQKHFALNTELIETLNRVNRSKLVRDQVEPDEIELKKTSIDIFQGLLEGQGEKSQVYERVLSVVHLDIILLMSKKQTLRAELPPDPSLAKSKAGKKKQKAEPVSEEQIILQTECVVLLQMLCNFKPSLYDELGISRNIEDIVGSGTAMIEIIWRGDIHRRFFHVPSVCKYLAKSSTDSLVESTDRSNAENKLVDFLNRSHELYREVKHQQYLTKIGVSRVFSRNNQDRATWITFILAVVINLMFLLYYNAGHRDPFLRESVVLGITILNTIQAVVAGFVLLLFLVVRIPVKYQSLKAAGYSEFQTMMYTIMEPMTLYYIWYLAFTILGQVVSYDFLPFLLLDIIVKNSTTRDVLNAVIVPRMQIAMGGLLILFIVQIYSFFLFYYFRDDLNEQAQYFCDTMFGCYLVALGYGLRSGGGFGDVFNVTIGRRWVVDVSFYFVITIGMLNLIGGVIITTFGQLREEQAKRLDDTLNVCYICAIDKQVFDRASDEPDGFKTHITIDHNMWNYLYFIFLLWEQDKDDDDGLEQYVRRAIEANEIMWFPLNQAIRLDQAASVEESLINDLRKAITVSENGVANKLEKFQGDINLVLEQLNQTLKQDHQQQNKDKDSIGHFGKVRGLTSALLKDMHGDGVNSAALQQLNMPSDVYSAFNRRVMLFVDLISVNNIPLPPPWNLITAAEKKTNFDKFSLQVTLDGAVFVIPATYDATKKRLTCKGEKRFKLVENLTPFDRRPVKFQALLESSGSASNLNNKLLVDLVSIDVEELNLASGVQLNSFFSVRGQDTKAKITLRSDCIKLY